VPGHLARYTSKLVVDALCGYKTGKVCQCGKLKWSRDALHISTNVAFYPIDWVERHIHVIARTSMTGILGHNALEIA
jgi:hypothetical protein